MKTTKASIKIVLVNEKKLLTDLKPLETLNKVSIGTLSFTELLKKDFKDDAENVLFLLSETDYFKNISFFKDVFKKNISLGKKIGFILLESSNQNVSEEDFKKEAFYERSKAILGKISKPISKEDLIQKIDYALLEVSNNGSLNKVSHSSQNINYFETLRALSFDLSESKSVEEFIKKVIEKTHEISLANNFFILLKTKMSMNEVQNCPLEEIYPHPNSDIEINCSCIDGEKLKSIDKNYIKNEFRYDTLISEEYFKVFNAALKYEKNLKLGLNHVLPIHSKSLGILGYLILVKSSFKETPNTKLSSSQIQILEVIINMLSTFLEKSMAKQQLNRCFEEIVNSSLTAIESRDPPTRGHSERVAKLTVTLAKKVNQTQSGSYKNLHFSNKQLLEINYASLLHDFGKISIPDAVMNKDKKLFKYELKVIFSRINALKHEIKSDLLEELIKKNIDNNQTLDDNQYKKILLKYNEKIALIQKFKTILLEINEPTVTHKDVIDSLMNLSRISYEISPNKNSILTEDEVQKLSVTKGSLSSYERKIIEEHVSDSYKFLIKIPWSKDLENIPDIVYCHHEKLNCTGYPRKLHSKDIPVQAKIMVIADIYDALVAPDRPYKPAVPHREALKIIDDEVKDGKIDKDFFKIFVEADVGQVIINDIKNLKH